MTTDAFGAFAHPGQTLMSHAERHDLIRIKLQLGGEPPRPITPGVPPEGRDDLQRQGVGQRGALLPGIEATATDVQGLTKNRDSIVCRLLSDEGINRRYVGRQKRLKAFLGCRARSQPV